MQIYAKQAQPQPMGRGPWANISELGQGGPSAFSFCFARCFWQEGARKPNFLQGWVEFLFFVFLSFLTVTIKDTRVHQVPLARVENAKARNSPLERTSSVPLIKILTNLWNPAFLSPRENLSPTPHFFFLPDVRVWLSDLAKSLHLKETSQVSRCSEVYSSQLQKRLKKSR